MATLKQVADRAGVALSTVSFVLNKNPRVSQETRDVVLSAVKELNYTLRPKGRPVRGSSEAAMPRRSNLIAFLVPCSEPQLRMSGTYLSTLEAAEAALAKANKGMIIRTMAQNDMPDQAGLLLKVDGALMILHKPAKDVSKIVTRVPIVQVLGLSSPDARWDQVTYNSSAIGGLAARYLLERGHRNCAFFSPHPGGLRYADRERLFVETIRAGGSTVRVNTRGLSIDAMSHSPEEMRGLLGELLLSKPRPTGLFFPSDYFTHLSYGQLFSMGLRPGHNLDVISCDNDETIMRGLHPRPASIDIHSRWIGSMGVAQLLQRLEAPELPRNVRWFEPTLVPAGYPWPTNNKGI